MKNKFLFKTILLIFLLFPFFSSISAQNIYITKINDLDFGEVFIGYSSTIRDTDINAAKFVFYHTKWFRRNIQVNFVLPTTLNNGGNKIRITFDQSQASWSYNDRQSGRRNFDPHSVLKIRRVWFYRNVYLWLGGTITTTSDLPYGIYSGTILLTVAY
ncbi:MAG: DUF4402 domain-containing protein [Melioribacteraceae bacterium]|nr:DUF4402 domain-containing protein [Melioribacteraceae bacterium]